MNSSIDDIKDKAKRLLLRNEEEKALRFLMLKLNVTREQASRLSKSILDENQNNANAILQEFTSRTGSAIQSLIPLALKGTGIALGVMSVFTIIGCGAGYYMARQYESTAIVVEGTVIDWRYTDDQEQVWPIIQYEFDTEKFSIETEMTYFPGEYPIGERVRLLVSTESPSQAVIDSFHERYLPLYVIGGLGIGLLMFSIFLIVAARRYRRRLTV